MLNQEKKVTGIIGDREFSISTGVMAKQANGAVIVSSGKAKVLVTSTMSKEPREGISFFPLTVEYIERMYAAGKIPGGFFKREAKPRTSATLAARLIDRAIRPCFPAYFFNEVQIVTTILSHDEDIVAEQLGMIGASAALSISDIPFKGPIAGISVIKVADEWIVNPTAKQLEESDLDVFIAGSSDAILMIEAGANEVSEDEIIKAIKLGHETIKKIIELQHTLQQSVSKEKVKFSPPETSLEIQSQMREMIKPEIEKTFQNADKKKVEDFLKQLEEKVFETFISKEEGNEEKGNEELVKRIYAEEKKKAIRDTIIHNKVRPDGRRADEIRPVEVEVNLLPSAHGSALFTRGETQSLGVITLGAVDDEQMEDGLAEKHTKNYYFHYNFPPYSVGEAGRMSFVSRRELGHGALAERALKAILPDYDTFPYTIRIVSEILESNGSSSMASVCSGTLALMDAGAPIKAPVSGIAMGLLIDKDDYVILSDIQGLEDHYGDMDFKVAGTKKGITALQLDIKVGGLSEEILKSALSQANKGRLAILDKMLEVIDEPRKELSENAPKIAYLKVNPDKIGMIIGAGGKMIKKIEQDTNAKIMIADGDKGEVCISSSDSESIEKAKNFIELLTKDLEKGDILEGKVVKITNFGAFIEMAPGKEGLIHISKLSQKRIEKVEDVLSIGEKIVVKVNEIDAQNRINLVPKDPLNA